MLSQVIARYQYFEEQCSIAQQKPFGKSAEGHPGQGELFNEAEELAAEDVLPEQERRNKPKRKPLPKDLPR